MQISGAEGATRIGSGCYFMAGAHAGHNAKVGNRVILTNQVAVAGHVWIDDGCVVSGQCLIHQFVRVGRLAMLGGYSKVVQDVPPFMLADGRPADILDLNIRGLRRAEVPASSRAALKQAYKLLYRSNLNISQALEAIEEEVEATTEVAHLVEFIKQIGEGGFGRANDRPRRR